MSQDESVTPRACQTPPRTSNAAPPFRKIIGEEPVTPATTVLQPDSTTVRQQASVNGAQSTVIQSENKPPYDHANEACDSRDHSTAHTALTGEAVAAARAVPINVHIPPGQSISKGTCSSDEWNCMSIPEEWAPVPTVVVTVTPGITDDQLVSFLIRHLPDSAFKIKSVHVDTPTQDGGAMGIIRLKLMRTVLDAEQTAHSDSNLSMPIADVRSIAAHAVGILNGASFSDDLETVCATAENVQVCMCLANLPNALRSASALTSALQPFGPLERVCLISNPADEMKGYAIIEFTLPSQARKAYEQLTSASLVVQSSFHPSTQLGPPDDSMHDLLLSSSVLVSWSNARHVSECFSTALFLTHVPDSYLVLDDQLSNTLADAAQCTPDDIVEILGHGAISESLSTAGRMGAKDVRCGRMWGYVRFKRADHCDAAFRKLQERAERGEDALRVVFAPPDYMVQHSATCGNAAPAKPAVGIKGPGFAPGHDRSSIQRSFRALAKASKSAAWAAAHAAQSQNGTDGTQPDVDQVASLASTDQFNTTVAPQLKDGKTGQDGSMLQSMQGATKRCKPGKGRSSVNTGSSCKSSRNTKRSHRADQFANCRPPGVPQHHTLQHMPANGFRNEVGARPFPWSFLHFQPQMYPTGAPHVRPMMASVPGVHAVPRHSAMMPTTQQQPHRNHPIIHQAPRPPLSHSGSHPIRAPWIQPPAAPVPAENLARPLQVAPQASNGLHSLPCQVPQLTQQLPTIHQFHMDQHSHVQRAQAMQRVSRPLAHHHQAQQVSPQQRAVLQRVTSQPPSCPEVTPSTSQNTGAAAQTIHHVVPQSCPNAQLSHAERTYQPQPAQYGCTVQNTSNVSHQNLQEHYSASYRAEVLQSSEVPQIGHKQDYQEVASVYPKMYGYNCAPQQGQLYRGVYGGFGS
eukprot:jgi/Ulvmu1/1514/UM011_0244.1